MAEENQVTINIEETTKGQKKETMRGPKEVTTKDPKKIEVGNRLVEWNHKNKNLKKSEVGQYYGIGVVLAVGVIGSLGYNLYQAKKGKVNVVPNNSPQPRPQTNKFEIL